MKTFRDAPDLKRGISVCVLFISIGAICYFLTTNLRPVPDPAELLPPSTVALLKWNNFAKSFERFKTSPVGKKLLDRDLADDLELCGICLTSQLQIQRLADTIEKISNHSLFPMLLGKRASVALLPPAHDNLDISEFLEQNLVFMAEVKGPFAEYAIRQRLTSYITSNPELFQGIEVNQITMRDGQHAYFALIDRMLVAAGSKKVIQRCLQVYKDRLIRPRVSLIQDHTYTRLKQYTPEQEVCFMYINPGFEKNGWQLAHFLPRQGAGFLGPDTRFLFLHQKNKDRDHFSFVAAGIPQEADTLFKKYFAATPKVHQHLSMIDANASAYLWTNWFDLQSLWQGLSETSEMQTAAILFYVNNIVQDHTGLDMETLTGMFGDELGLLITDFPSTDFATVPMICLQIKIKDSHAVRRLLRKMLVNVPSRSVVVEGVPGTSLVLANGLIEPTYLFYEDYLVIADSAELIRHWVGTQKKKMVASTEFKMVENGLLSTNNFLSYARIDKVNNGLEKMLQWTLYSLNQAEWITLQQAAFIQDEVVKTLFESLQAVRSQGIRVVMKDDVLLGELNLYSPQTIRNTK